MSELLYRFSLDASKFNAAVILCLVGLWLMVLWCTAASILCQPFTKRQIRFWFCLVIFLPFLGVLAYLPFSFRREDLPHAFLLKQKGKTKKRFSRHSPEPGDSRA